MSEFTIQGFYKLFEIKGYNQMAQFFSTSFDFTDKIEEGLKRVELNILGQHGASKFSISVYPVWDEQEKPYVSAYLSCCYNDGKFSINSLDLTYSDAQYNGRSHSNTIEKPTLTEIPDQGVLRRELRSYMQGQGFKENRTNNKNYKL